MYYSTDTCTDTCTTVQIHVLQHRYMYYSTDTCTTAQIHVLQYRYMHRYMYYSTDTCTDTCTTVQIHGAVVAILYGLCNETVGECVEPETQCWIAEVIPVAVEKEIVALHWTLDTSNSNKLWLVSLKLCYVFLKISKSQKMSSQVIWIYIHAITISLKL